MGWEEGQGAEVKGKDRRREDERRKMKTGVNEQGDNVKRGRTSTSQDTESTQCGTEKYLSASEK